MVSAGSSSHEGSEEARSVFAAFLARRERGEEADIEGLCGEHPALGEALRALWARHLVDLALGDFDVFQGPQAPPDEGLAPARARSGDRIAGYRLVRLLGQGGMGEVWLADQVELRRRVALKLVRPDRVSDDAFELFAREARAGGRLNHPGIVAVHDFGKEGGQAWIAMELVSGSRTLRDFLKDVRGAGTLPEGYFRKAASLVARVADALQAAHDARVVHRDVKPQNILLGKHGPKLTDFGLARIEDEDSISRAGSFAGTYAYSSPEQVAAKRAGIDSRTDVFSLGVVLYELLSLEQPFTGETTTEIADKILTWDPPDLHDVNPEIPRDLATICHKAMEKARSLRHQTMEELGAQLHRFLAGEPITDRAPSRLRRLARRVARHRSAGALAATAVAAGLFAYALAARPPAPPFSGAGYERVRITAAGGLRSPAFVGERLVVLERTAAGGRPGLAVVDLTSQNLAVRDWSPQGLACGAPAVSPDRQWLSYEIPVAAPGGGERSAICLARLDADALPLPWPADVAERLAPAGAAVRGVRWSPLNAFAYTQDLGTSLALRLHDPSGAPDIEVLRQPRGLADAIQVCFSPDGARLAIAGTDRLRIFELAGPAPRELEPRSLDCGTYADPLWLRDGSFLATRLSYQGTPARVHWLEERRASPVTWLESLPKGQYGDLAISPSGGRLALTTRVSTGHFFVAEPGGATPVEQLLPATPVAPIWTPEGNLVYARESAGVGRALFVLEPGAAVDSPLTVEVPQIRLPWSELYADQLAFSQNGEHLVFRLKGEEGNGRCDAQEWIVVASWPPARDRTVAVRMPRRVSFPHVTDDGARVTWSEGAETFTLYTARVDGEELREISRVAAGTNLPARITGDGRWIAVSIPGASSPDVAVLELDGTIVEVIEDPGNSYVARWLPQAPGAPAELAYFDGQGDVVTVRAAVPGSAQPRVDLTRVQMSVNPQWASYDPRGARVAYTIERAEDDAELWLVRPVDR